MCRAGWILAALFSMLLGAVLYRFVVLGNTEPSTDGRTAILLSPSERDLVLGEMRGFLVAVQTVLASTNSGDMPAAAQAARKAGMAGVGEVPASLMGKLPITFKTLGMDTHQRFDQLALDAESLADPAYANKQLSDLMRNCLGCHNAYRFELESK